MLDRSLHGLGLGWRGLEKYTVVGMIRVSHVLDCLGRIVAHINARLEHLVLISDNLSEPVDRFHGEVDLLD